MKKFIQVAWKQITGREFRSAKISLSWLANTQRNELGLDMETIEDVFKHGRPVTSLVQNYGNYSISISYKWDARKNEYVITSVRNYENTERR